MIVKICWDDGEFHDHGPCLKPDERFKIFNKESRGDWNNLFNEPGIDIKIVARKQLMYEIVHEYLSEFEEVKKHQIYELTEVEFALLLLKI